MTFNNAQGSAVSFTLPVPRADLTALEVEAVMDQMITKNIFLTSGGALISKRDIRTIWIDEGSRGPTVTLTSVFRS